jgi:Rrf2 family protein
MMKISTKARYSIRLMVYLADNAHLEKPIVLRQIAENQNLPPRYLEQLVVLLKSASLVRSVSGKRGGYFLAREASEIKVGEIMEAATGPIKIMDCLDSGFSCKFLDLCTSRRMWGLINTRITDILYDYTLEDLSEKKMQEVFEKKLEKKKDETLGC